MQLNQLFKGAPNIEIEQLSEDSRLPMKNAIFFCLDGIKYDGHNYIDEAISNGAKVIVYSKEITNNKNAIYIKVKNVNETLSRISEIFYNHPNSNIDKYLISGCYGRSTVSMIINHYLNSVSTCGSVGIFGINYLGKHLSLSYPTLTPLDNLKALDNFKKNNIKNCTFETNVISLYYKKFDVIKPDVFIYTNTSKFSADYNVCNSYYFSNIRKYLYTLEDKTCVLFNGDDDAFEELKDSVNNYATYGFSDNCTYKIIDANLSNDGVRFKIVHNDMVYEVKSKLIGNVNIYNLTASIAALNLRGHDIKDVIDKLNDIDYVDGVMEVVDKDYNVILDCGYEIDSINSLLKYAKDTCKGKLIGIIGINYSDSDKRIENILKICEKFLDVIILTEDESMQSEVMDILARTNKYIHTKKVVQIPHRSSAIENGVEIMNKNDTLLIIGKGNETFLNMGLGKEKYAGDKYYVLKYLKNRKEPITNEII